MSTKENNGLIWVVSREYAGFAEAGGVKNVVKSLAEAAAAYGLTVTVFLPRYGNNSEDLDNCIGEAQIRVGDTPHLVRYFELFRKNIRFIFIDSGIFTEKKDIYTYCAEELDYFREKLHRPDLKKGDGYIDNHEMNVLFQKAVYCYGLRNHTAPQVLHCHDAHTALLPAFISARCTGRRLFRHTRTLITIHNAGDGYRQTFYSFEYAAHLTDLPHRVLEYGRVDYTVEPFLVGSAFADLTTVSPWYAKQLISPEHSPYSYLFSKTLAQKHIHITGITNGIDFGAYNPCDMECSGLPFAFDIQKEQFEGKYACRSFLLDKLQSQTCTAPLYDGIQQYGSMSTQEEKRTLYLMYHGRLVRQKGIDVLLKAIPRILERSPNLRFIVMGQGNPELEAEAIALAAALPGKFVYCKGYNRNAARLITAAADFIVLPSLFEPCGLEDLIAQVYGTIPIANAQGGLQKIINGKTGFLYTLPNGEEQNTDIHISALTEAVLNQAESFFATDKARLTDIPYFKNIILQACTALHTEFSWKHIFTQQYLKLYFPN
ncbi:glycogen/starch synthase [Treponema sp. OMZ 838]|uniref:glycogen synthase n=1 Tax=Treponema sp. OMZ 838 TaxID=1539298 RepID=UPI00053013F5|nr:glycogen/starch synthase [Treponema sp. OMZ 838]AIW88859.1 glycogen/starch synthase [Treponema sp. OMZ 838]